MIENTNTKQFYPGPILNNTLEITDFLFNDAEQIKVKHSKLNEEGVLIDIDLAYPMDYEVTKILPSDINATEAVLTASTGQVMLKNINVLAGEKLTVYRVSQIIQDMDYPRTGAFPAASHEGALDYLTMQNQEQQEQINRSLKIPNSVETFDAQMPTPLPARALKINADGTGFEMSEFDPDVALITTEEFKNQAQQAAIEALASQNVATEQSTIATEQANIATEQANIATGQATIATEQATIATNKTSEVVTSGNEALSNIDTAKNNAITSITNQETTSKTSLIDEGATQIGLIQNEGATQIANVQSTGFYMRDDKLYFINSQGEETAFKSDGGFEICDIGMALYVDETKGLRRYLNGQIVDINTNTQAFLNRLLEIKNTNPDNFTDEATWQSEATLNVDGCVYKFVLNYDSTGTNVVSVRLPKYPDYVEINAGGTLPVVGNGMTLGFTNGTDFGGISANTTGGLLINRDLYGKPVNTAFGSNTYLRTGKSFGITTDGTKSGIQTTLNQTKLKMRYFIQIATGSETENNIINDIELNNPYSLFDSKYSDHELNNLSWLKSSGQWNAKAVYPTAYDKLLKVYNGTETVEGLSVKLSTETYTDYDFVLNTAEETFRLPLKTNLASGKAVVGNGMTLGLTNGAQNGGLTTISNNLVAREDVYDSNKGSVSSSSNIIGNNSSIGITTDPTKSGIELSDSNLYLYYYVGETVQNANLIDAGRIGEQLAGKVDLDLANLSSEGKEAMTAYWIASGSPTINIPINLTISTTTQYWEAPSNGYVWFYMASASSGAVGFIVVKEEHPDIWSIVNISRGWLYINKGQHLSVRTDVGTFTLGVLLFTAKQ